MNPRKSVGTAYLAYSGRLLAEIAQALGKAEDAVQYRDTAEKARLAYRAAFTDNGKITSDRQCEYVRAIAFALLVCFGIMFVVATAIAMTIGKGAA